MSHGGRDPLLQPVAAVTPCSARRTWSTVTIPRSMPSESTAMIAPRRASPSRPSAASSGSARPTPRAPAAAARGPPGGAGGRLCPAPPPRPAPAPPDEPALGVDDGKPGPAVAQEVVVEHAVDADV